ncbi:TonB-dependent receptor domain-containing protein [Carnimonas nigrificans]|uniref:TonB-dependent receptor domain-containing protein n=1 Tax=Carnimonas nigrificans TaxID=64323 RepID=UPI000470606B|nr:TonB-dependent receptor [Carnimonas nigrificans]
MNLYRCPSRTLLALSLAFPPYCWGAQALTNDDARQRSERDHAATEVEHSSAEAALAPMVVTAALTPQTADQSLASVTLLDRKALTRQAPVSLTDVLRSQPGVDVTSNGGPGAPSNVYIRGANAQSSTLLIDGIRLRSATTGTAAYHYLDPAIFNRAELVRGPRGSLYGADAAGGVIQLFTDDEQPGIRPRLSVGGGSHATWHSTASLSGRQNGTGFTFAASSINSNGTRDRAGGSGQSYDNHTALLHLSHDFDNGARIGGLLLRARGHSDYDGGESRFSGSNAFVQQVAGVYGEVPLLPNLKSRVTLSQADDKLDNAGDGMSTSHLNTRTQRVRWQNTLTLGQQQLIAGAEYADDRVTGNTDYTHRHRDNKAVFAQGVFDLTPLRVQASVRHDDNQAFGETTTGGLALGYSLDSVHTLRASWGNAFRVPTFNELYWPNDGFFSGNPDLKPEKSSTVELGMRAEHRLGFWDIALYQSRYRDLINYAADDYSREVNINRARIQGVELSGGIHPGPWNINASLSYMKPEDRSSGLDLQNRTRRIARLDVDRQLGERFDAGGSVIAQGSRFADTANTDKVAGFTIFDLRSGVRLAKGVRLQASIDNLLNHRYQSVQGYLEPGRTAMLTLSLDPSL